MLHSASLIPERDSFAVDAYNSAGLNLHVGGGHLIVSGVANWRSVAATVIALTASATNYVEVSAAGVLSANTTAFTAASTPLFVVTTSATAVTGIQDWRGNPQVADLIDYLQSGLLAIGTLTVSGGDATKFKTTSTAIYRISGLPYAKVATDTLAFTTAGTINTAGAATTAHWGAWLVQISSAGTITTKAVGGGATDQDYASEALAIAALPAADAGNASLGYITVQGLASTAWTATTSNLTVGGGAGNCTARSFYNLPSAKTLPSVVV